MQHNCALHKCQADGTRSVFQERQLTTQTVPIVSHRGPASDLILNTAQMRDAIHVQKFRVVSPTLNSEAILTASAAREVAIRKAKAATSKTPKLAPAPARGSALPTAQQAAQPRRLTALQTAQPRASTSSSRD